MATRLKEVDAVLIGVGLVGTMLGRELTRAGLKVVGLERGNPQFTVPDWQAPQMHDELRYSIRKAFMQDNTKEAMTFRNNPDQVALPIRRWESFLPGTGLGGAAVHWNGQTYRFQDAHFRMRSHNIERYGKDFIDPELTIQDWGVTHAELEPYYDRFEYLLGTCGQAGNIKGQKISGGNPFEEPRSRPYPNPPMKEPYGSAIFRQAASSLGYSPFPQPSSNMSRPYTNPEGMTLQTCMFCGYCERYGCEHYAKSSPQTILLPVLLKDKNFTLRTNSHVLRINLAKDRKHATGVTYVDAAGREFEQPAKLVILCSFSLNNVRMLLLSGIGQPYDPRSGQGTLGRNYAYQTMSAVQVFFDESVNINPFMRSGANGTLIADFAADNYDHGPHKFVGGVYFGELSTNGRPIEFHPTPPGTPGWGAAWKAAVVRHYNHTAIININGSSASCRTNYLDLDPTYKDAWGLPLLRITFDFPANDLRMSAYVTGKAREVGRAMGGRIVAGEGRKGPYVVTQYQTTHNTGGAIMGVDRTNSVVNRYMQHWDVPNLFVIGASAFPQNAEYNPTGTVGALAYMSAEAIVTRYLKTPGPLVQA
ncbi:GMC family oxidoreductase [Massilia horti]|uniref:GMC family oxidoreductase n=1 Tax=Massilia horti TaxID=2562153 RepID=A0A4Y9T1Q5_9BURK|nr:GMC family oxidoreductase [Massilia horti]TFW31519.1 GMC family oxidoreductase [Massilia horti]